MKKALDILNNGIVFMTMHKDLNPQSSEYLEAEIAQYEEAIDELNKMTSCDGCKFNRFGCDSAGLAVECIVQPYGCSRIVIDRYEPKDSNV